MQRLLWFGLVGLIGLVTGACSSTHSSGPAKTYMAPASVPSAAPQIKEISTQVQAAATSNGDAATAIRSNAIDGKAQTPPDILPTLGKFWDAILAGADRVQNTAQDLNGLHQRVDDLSVQVASKDAETATLRTSLASANTAIQTEHDARVKAEAAEAQAKSDQAAHLEHLLFGVAITSLLGLGASVTIGLLMHDIRISIAGGAGCLAMAIGCFLLGEVIHYRFWILAGLATIAAVLAIYEFLLHRQLIMAGVMNRGS